MSDLLTKAEVQNEIIGDESAPRNRLARTALAAITRADAADIRARRAESDRDHWVSRIEATAKLVLPTDTSLAPPGELLDGIATQAEFQQVKIAELATELYDEREHKSNLEYGYICTCAGCKLKAAMDGLADVDLALAEGASETPRGKAVANWIGKCQAADAEVEKLRAVRDALLESQIQRDEEWAAEVATHADTETAMAKDLAELRRAAEAWEAMDDGKVHTVQRVSCDVSHWFVATGRGPKSSQADNPIDAVLEAAKAKGE